MTINPTPVVSIDGVTRTCLVADHQGRPVLDGDQATILAGLRIRWGRRDIWNTPPPSTCTVDLFDPGHVVMPSVRDGSLFDRTVVVSVSLVPFAGIRYLFRGAVTNATATERTMDTSRGRLTGWMIRFTAVDPRATLRNRTVNAVYPSQSYSQRVASIRSVIGGSNPNAMAPWTPSVDVTTSTLWADTYSGDRDQLLATLAATTGDHHQYNPDAGAYQLIQTVAGEGTSAVLMDLGDNAVTIRATNASLGSQTWTGTTLDGCRVARTGDDLDTEATDQIVSWRVRHGASGTTVEAERWDTSVPGTRAPYSVEYRSWLGTAAASLVADELKRRGQNEGRGPHHPPVEVRTTPDRGFDSYTQAAAILRTWEEPQPIAITGSPWTRATGFSLTHVIQGGDLTYTRGGWRHRLTLRRTRGAQHRNFMTTWTHLSGPGLKWGDDPDAGRYFVPSVTWADLGSGTWSLPISPPQE